MLPEAANIGPLEQLSINRFGGRTVASELTLSVSAATVTRIMPNNPNRIFWEIINEGANDVRVSTEPTITSTSGWLLPAGSGVIVSFWEEDGESVGYAVYAISVAVASTVRVREVTRL